MMVTPPAAAPQDTGSPVIGVERPSWSWMRSGISQEAAIPYEAVVPKRSGGCRSMRASASFVGLGRANGRPTEPLVHRMLWGSEFGIFRKAGEFLLRGFFLWEVRFVWYWFLRLPDRRELEHRQIAATQYIGPSLSVLLPEEPSASTPNGERTREHINEVYRWLSRPMGLASWSASTTTNKRKTGGTPIADVSRNVVGIAAMPDDAAWYTAAGARKNMESVLKWVDDESHTTRLPTLRPQPLRPFLPALLGDGSSRNGQYTPLKSDSPKILPENAPATAEQRKNQSSEKHLSAAQSRDIPLWGQRGDSGARTHEWGQRGDSGALTHESGGRTHEWSWLKTRNRLKAASNKMPPP